MCCTVTLRESRHASVASAVLFINATEGAEPTACPPFASFHLKRRRHSPLSPSMHLELNIARGCLSPLSLCYASYRVGDIEVACVKRNGERVEEKVRRRVSTVGQPYYRYSPKDLLRTITNCLLLSPTPTFSCVLREGIAVLRVRRSFILDIYLCRAIQRNFYGAVFDKQAVSSEYPSQILSTERCL